MKIDLQEIEYERVDLRTWLRIKTGGWDLEFGDKSLGAIQFWEFLF
jgi:hypothetical protein